ncbi:pyridoxal-phosphate-dependent aminotransferase family protein [Virgibacillus sp. MG-45]|uniref:pyridoxal-phosphate-dependent aminotransferase family protein n=1 Tax=Virgibacillus sp. MG-45 TaxID=3102791 RepID=UPI002EDB7382
MSYTDLNIPTRTIMTPGPVEVDPRVLRALSTPIIGQFDPSFLALMDETMELLRSVFQTSNKQAFPVDGTSRSGIEAVLVSVIEPGDKVLIPIFGRFGHLLVEIANRCGAEVYALEKEWGQVFDPEEIIKEIKKVNPKLVAIVHGETSTGRMQPLEEIGHFCRENDVLLIVDAVATLGGVPFKTDEWNVDAVIAGTQKCIGAPTGMAPVTYNERIEKILQQRKKIEQGLSLDSINPRRIQSNYMDLSQIQDYWSPNRLNHHTEATTMLYALREALRLIEEEGLEARFERHKIHEKALVLGLQEMGLELFGDEKNKMPVVTVVKVPGEINEAQVRATMINEFGIEIAGAFGSLKGHVWRIGAMGYSSRKSNILSVLSALEATLIYYGAKVNRGEALQAVLAFYQSIEK